MNWDIISNLINNEFKERYCSNEDFLELSTDNKNIIKITNERLKPHFLSESKVKAKNRFKLYSFSSQKFKSLVKSIFESSNHENWEPDFCRILYTLILLYTIFPLEFLYIQLQIITKNKQISL